MPQVQLDEQVFKLAQRRAADAGYLSVDEYIADAVVRGQGDDTDNFNHLFTVDRLAHIDKAEAEIKAGNSYSTEQANAELAKRRAQWLATNPR